MPPTSEELYQLTRTDIREIIPNDIVSEVVSAPPFVPSQILNHRDAGLVPGSRIRPGLVYRSAFIKPNAVSTAWIAANVKTIFDLRRRGEREAVPDPVVEGVEHRAFEQTDKPYDGPRLPDFAIGDGSEAWKRQYLLYFRDYGVGYRAVLEHVRDRPGDAFLIHCTAGRDRTGVLIGILHGLAGSPPQTILHDYLLTRIGIEPERATLEKHLRRMVGITDPNTPGYANMANMMASSWEAFVAGVHETYGGWDGYVRSLGFSDEELERMKRNLRGE